jgi:hypothetical protein
MHRRYSLKSTLLRQGSHHKKESNQQMKAETAGTRAFTAVDTIIISGAAAAPGTPSHKRTGVIAGPTSC